MTEIPATTNVTAAVETVKETITPTAQIASPVSESSKIYTGLVLKIIGTIAVCGIIYFLYRKYVKKGDEK